MRIEIKDLCKEFPGGAQVLRGVNFADEVSSLAIIGPSGGGKSTLLRVLGGLIAPTSGNFSMDGMEILQDERNLIAHRREIGFVFQRGGLFHHMTALENITVPLVQVHGMASDEAEQRARELLARFGLAGEADKRPAALSGGQQQRIAIARAIAPNPKLLLLDEPTSALDPEYTSEVLDMVSELSNGGVRFVIVTHEMGFARRACAAAAFLSDGVIMEYGPSEELFTAPKTPQLQRFLARVLEWNI